MIISLYRKKTIVILEHDQGFVYEENAVTVLKRSVFSIDLLLMLESAAVMQIETTGFCVAELMTLALALVFTEALNVA